MVVNAVVQLLQAGSPTGSSATATSAAPALSPSDAGVARDFVCRLLAQGRVTVAPAFVVQQLLRHLAGMAGAGGGGGGGAASVRAEDAFIAIVQVGARGEGGMAGGRVAPG